MTTTTWMHRPRSGISLLSKSDDNRLEMGLFSFRIFSHKYEGWEVTRSTMTKFPSITLTHGTSTCKYSQFQSECLLKGGKEGEGEEEEVDKESMCLDMMTWRQDINKHHLEFFSYTIKLFLTPQHQEAREITSIAKLLAHRQRYLFPWLDISIYVSSVSFFQKNTKQNLLL